jgi:hypothetical protein
MEDTIDISTDNDDSESLTVETSNEENDTSDDVSSGDVKPDESSNKLDDKVKPDNALKVEWDIENDEDGQMKIF